jgi:hypothetical protein
MYLRWKYEGQCFDGQNSRYLKTAWRYRLLLVESVRLPGVKTPRQRMVAYLGLINEWRLSMDRHASTLALYAQYGHSNWAQERWTSETDRIRRRFRYGVLRRLERLCERGVIAAAFATAIMAEVDAAVPMAHREDGKLIMPPLAISAARHERAQACTKRSDEYLRQHP